MYSPEEIHEITAEKGTIKASKPLMYRLVLGFVAGGLIALGYMGFIRVTASMTGELASLGTFIGASVFPVGLIGLLLGGGELATGNMMALSTAFFARRISFGDMAKNILTVSFANLLGALFVAYFLGYSTGLTSTGIYLETTVNVAAGKLASTPWQAFLSGIGCNWLVGLAVWLSYGAKDTTGKVIVIWFPIMAFVAIGFQHSVANMFVVPAAIFAGSFTWTQFLGNLIPVWLGNIIGAGIFVSFLYYFTLNKELLLHFKQRRKKEAQRKAQGETLTESQTETRREE